MCTLKQEQISSQAPCYTVPQSSAITISKTWNKTNGSSINFYYMLLVLLVELLKSKYWLHNEKFWYKNDFKFLLLILNVFNNV